MVYNYEDVMSTLNEMRSRYSSGFSSVDRDYLNTLHIHLFNKPVKNTGCADCYRDAYLIIYNKLKKEKKMPKQPNYILKAGAIIHPFGTNDYYSRVVTDEVAEKYLQERPDRIVLFERYPEDWHDRVFPREEKAEEPVAEDVEEPTNEEVESTAEEVEEPATVEPETPVAEEKSAETEAPKRRGRPSKK